MKISEIMLSKERSMHSSTSLSLLEGQTWWWEPRQPYWGRRQHPELRMAEWADGGSLCPWHCAAAMHSQSCPSKLWEKINIYPVWASVFHYKSLTRFLSNIHVKSKIQIKSCRSHRICEVVNPKNVFNDKWKKKQHVSNNLKRTFYLLMYFIFHYNQEDGTNIKKDLRAHIKIAGSLFFLPVQFYFKKKIWIPGISLLIKIKLF